MPALSASVSIQAGELAGANVDALQGLNETLHFGKNNANVKLRFLATDVKKKGLMGMTNAMFADAALDVRRDHSSQGGYILLVGSEEIPTGVCQEFADQAWQKHGNST